MRRDDVQGEEKRGGAMRGERLAPGRSRRPSRPPPRLGRPARRLQTSLSVVAVVLVVLTGRLVQLQGVDAAAYASRAEQQRIRHTDLPATRGTIVDRAGNVLARTVEADTVFADPQLARVAVSTTAARLAPVLGTTAAALAPQLTRPGRFVVLARAVDPATAQRIRELTLPGIGIQAGSMREHPGHELAANLIGFTGRDGTGLAGIESSQQDVLAGRAGSQTVEVDGSGRQIPSGVHKERDPVPGSSVALTIDRDIQWMAQQRIAQQVAATGAQSGSVIVLDPQTGEVLAMATAPTYDADHPGAAPTAARGNPPVSDVYEPGSVNKVITFAAALQEGTVTPLTPVTVPPTITLAGHVFHDAEVHATEHLTATGVLAKSSNIGTVEVAQKLGKDALYRYLRAFGFGQSTATALPGESRGILPPPQAWSATQQYTIPFGQGISVTALQMASVYATVANGGVRMPPRVLAATVAPDGQRKAVPPTPGKRVVSTEVAGQLRDMLEAVTSDQGTAPAARIEGYRVAGKTGTSQRVDPACGCYRGYTASFVGFAPADKPQLVVEAVLQDPVRGHYGGSVAAPVFHDVMSFALQSRAIPPTGTTPPVACLQLPCR